eukprot:219950-Rhodomonas_salina.2
MQLSRHRSSGKVVVDCVVVRMEGQELGVASALRERAWVAVCILRSRRLSRVTRLAQLGPFSGGLQGGDSRAVVPALPYAAFQTLGHKMRQFALGEQADLKLCFLRLNTYGMT